VRILYWNTSCLQPEIEAVSREVFQLAARFPGSLILGVSPHYSFRHSRRGRFVGFHPRFDPFLRVLFPLIERTGDISHVYGEPSPWIFHKTLRRRPIILTVASEKGGLVPEFLHRCTRIVAQTEGFRKRLLALGLAPERVELIYPGVDLKRFTPAGERPLGPTRILFASAPRTRTEMGPRGVELLLEAAREMPDVRLRLLFRLWNTGYDSLAATEAMIARDGLTNVTLTNSTVDDMAAVYREHHFTVIPYTAPDGGKECPNSLVEGLACGVPALISSVSPFAGFVESNRCGVVFKPTPGALAKAVEVGMSDWGALSRAARQAAECHFSFDGVLERYANLYAACLKRRQEA
jgi:glycosyltransferase involved in cell wall biosynthesis